MDETSIRKGSPKGRTFIYYVLMGLFLLSFFGGIGAICKKILERKYKIKKQNGSYFSFYQEEKNRFQLMVWTENLMAHPYFGYMYIGQFNELEYKKGVRDDKAFHVAILGGSVASTFGDFVSKGGEFVQKFEALPLVPKGRKVKFFNLASPSYKQPQQFFISSYFLEQIDLAINIDGFNELNLIRGLHFFPTEYPTQSARFFIHQEKAAFLKWTGKFLMTAHKVLTRLPLNYPLLAKDSLYFLSWKILIPAIVDSLAKTQNLYLVKNSGYNSLPLNDKASNRQWREEMASVWDKYTTLQNLIFKMNKKKVFFFLQPNQHLKGAKEFSELEKGIIDLESFYHEEVHLKMTLLKEKARKMKIKGLPVYDLTEIFKNTRETVFIDNCCHFNGRGNEILADNILSTLRNAGPP